MKYLVGILKAYLTYNTIMPKGVYKRTDEMRSNMSLAHKGQISHNKGKRLVDPEVSREKRKSYRRRWATANKDRILELDRSWKKKNRGRVSLLARLRYQKNPQRELDRIRFKKYGITGEEYRLIIEKQGVKCPICNRDITKNPSVDHDHVTGKIRGLICNNCNLSIGNAEDSPDRLRAMADYLERNK